LAEAAPDGEPVSCQKGIGTEVDMVGGGDGCRVLRL
jgi:hypothetical protein